MTAPATHGAIKIPLSPPLAKGGRGVCNDADREREGQVLRGSSTESQAAIETVTVSLGERSYPILQPPLSLLGGEEAGLKGL